VNSPIAIGGTAAVFLPAIVHDSSCDLQIST